MKGCEREVPGTSPWHGPITVTSNANRAEWMRTGDNSLLLDEYVGGENNEADFSWGSMREETEILMLGIVLWLAWDAGKRYEEAQL